MVSLYFAGLDPQPSTLHTKDKRALPLWAIAGILFGCLVFAHLPLLKLPYFWDEAGYYIPAARDLLQMGSLIPLSAPSNAHPPLVMAYLALWWKLAGSSPLVTRTAMLGIATFALVGLFRLASQTANRKVAWATVACTAAYPVFFTQSSMAHVDLAAAALTFWAIDGFLREDARATAIWFSLAVLAKETAILAPVALLGWSLVCPWIGARRARLVCRGTLSRRMMAALLTPTLILFAWYSYHFAKTGYVFGNPEFFRYNVQATMSPLRILLALIMRIWQTFGYLHMFVLTLLTCLAMTTAPMNDAGTERSRITIPTQCIFGAVILAYVIAMAVIGGAVLARYMLPVVPLVILIGVSTLWRRFRQWQLFVVAVVIVFTSGLFLNPPYGFALEDNLAYRDYIQMHQRAASYLQEHPPRSGVLTAWPASDELTRPYLGYVTHPFTVVRIEDFSFEQIVEASQVEAQFDAAFLFSTKYEPEHVGANRWMWWRNLKRRYFGFHEDLPPDAIAAALEGRVGFREQRDGQWVAVMKIEKAEDASRENLHRHEMAGMGFDDQPDDVAGDHLQRITSGQGQLHYELNATTNPHLYDYISLHESQNLSSQNIARAQPLGLFARKQDVSRLNPNSQARSWLSAHQWRLQDNAVSETAGHRSPLFVN